MFDPVLGDMADKSMFFFNNTIIKRRIVYWQSCSECI